MRPGLTDRRAECRHEKKLGRGHRQELHRKAHAKVAALAGLAGNRDLPTHQFDHLAADRQSQTGPLVAPAIGAVRLLKGVKNPADLIWSNANPSIADVQYEGELALGNVLGRHIHLDLGLRS